MINIVIADDSAFLRKILVDVLEGSGKIKVLFAAKNGKEALAAIEEKKPDLAIFDVEMPVMTGLEALRRVMEKNPLPVLMFSSLTREGASVTIKALEYGAADFFLKPTSVSDGMKEVGNQLIRKVEVLALKRKFQNVGGAQKSVPVDLAKSKMALNNVPTKGIDLIAIGSSTGGVQAALEVVKKLPERFPPIVWVQHMPMHFTERFAERMNSLSQLNIKEAKDKDQLDPGKCYLAPGGLQMRVVKGSNGRYFLNVGGTERVSGFCPSCDVLFDSIAALNPMKTLGVILTGMGSDGTKGLVQMHEKGSYVIGQDEMSSVVYGMPKAAFEAGAVDVQFDIKSIADAMIKVCKNY